MYTKQIDNILLLSVQLLIHSTTSQHGQNKKVAHEPPRRVSDEHSYHVMTSTVHYS